MSITRRLFLRHTATAAAASAVTAPGVAAPHAEEDIHDRVERLAWELADALNTYRDGKWYAQIYPSLPHDNPVGFFRESAKPKLTPDERIDAALVEIKAAFREKWPDCAIRFNDYEGGNQGMVMVATNVAGDNPGSIKFFGDRRPQS